LQKDKFSCCRAIKNLLDTGQVCFLADFYTHCDIKQSLLGKKTVAQKNSAKRVDGEGGRRSIIIN
jgi:hypothetical protein